LAWFAAHVSLIRKRDTYKRTTGLGFDIATQSAIESAQRLLGQGEPLLAYNAIQVGLESEPRDLRLRQLQGLTLARSGATEQANRLLAQLVTEGMADSETLGMLARTHKDLAFVAADAARRDHHLQAALELYHEAYESAVVSGKSAAAYYTGINAASMAVLRGDLATARRMASEVRDICHRLLRETNAAADYWLTATLGEAALILGEHSEARACYARASELARGRFGDLGSTRRQARLLAERLPGDNAWISQVLRIPPVVMFTGHITDPVAQVRSAAPAQLERLRPVALYASAACAADILYLEAMQEFGGESHIVLPYGSDEFRRVHFEGLSGNWRERFDRALAAASSITITSEHRARGSTASLDYANLVMSGIARLRAQVLGTDLVGLILSRRGATGGSASAPRLWREQAVTIDEMTVPEEPSGCVVAEVAAPPAADERVPEGFTHEIRAMLFADAVGYSKLNEDQIPIFVTHFLGSVAELNQRMACPPEHVETTGDGLYMVFASAREAGHYAMQLNNLVTGTDWAGLGLPEGMNIRIALHCGPVYCGGNPLTGARLYTGPHTSRTARIEPITPPGQVYASSAFAAVACALGVDDLSMTYIGRMALAKGYGELALYHVRAIRPRAAAVSGGCCGAAGA
jgi:tetratricopeptide (TPR) repeat protein